MTKPTMGDSRSAWRRFRKCGDTCLTWSRMPSFSMISMFFNAAAQDTGWPEIRVAVGEQHILLPGARNRCQHAVRNQACPQRQVAGGEPLGAGDQVRLDSEHVLGREPVAEAAESGDDLVGDVEHVVGAAHLQAALLVLGWRNDHPARGEHRLGDERTDPVWSDLGDGALQVRDLRAAPRIEAHPFGSQRRIDVGQEVRALDFDVKPAPAAFLAGDRGGQVCRAVICLLPRNHDLLVRPPQPVVVEVHETQRGIDRGRSAGGEEHGVQVAGGQVGELLRKQRARLARRVPGRVVGEPHHLVGDGIRHVPAAVADLRAPHSAGPVDQSLAVGCVDVDVLRPGRDRAVRPVRQPHGLPGMQVVPVVVVADGGGGVAER